MTRFDDLLALSRNISTKKAETQKEFEDLKSDLISWLSSVLGGKSDAYVVEQISSRLAHHSLSVCVNFQVPKEAPSIPKATVEARVTNLIYVLKIGGDSFDVIRNGGQLAQTTAVAFKLGDLIISPLEADMTRALQAL